MLLVSQMPTAPRRYCATPSCAERVTSGHCPTHARRVDQQRPNADVRTWYKLARWKHPVHGLRVHALRRYPICVDCATRGHVTPSTDADHQIPHRGDPALFWDLANLRGRCHRCHSRKTGQGE